MTRRVATRRVAALAALVLAGALITFVSPASAQYDQVLSCSFDRVNPGDVVTADGNGFLPGSTVALSITDDSDSVSAGPGDPTIPGGELDTAAVLIDLGTTTADANGQINFTFVVPDADVLPAGDYFVTAVGILNTGNEPRLISCPFEVVVPGVTGPIAFTGSNSKPIAEIAIAMIAVGGLAVVFARRRSARQSAQVST